MYVLDRAGKLSAEDNQALDIALKRLASSCFRSEMITLDAKKDVAANLVTHL